MNRTLVSALLPPVVLAVLASCSTTDPRPPKSGPYGGVDAGLWTDFKDHPKGYLPETQEPSALAFLSPPPDPASPRAIADLALYKAMLSEKNGPRWAQAAKDADVETPLAPQAFDCALGLVIDPATIPVLTRLLAKTMMDVDQAGEASKTHAEPAFNADLEAAHAELRNTEAKRAVPTPMRGQNRRACDAAILTR